MYTIINLHDSYSVMVWAPSPYVFQNYQILANIMQVYTVLVHNIQYKVDSQNIAATLHMQNLILGIWFSKQAHAIACLICTINTLAWSNWVSDMFKKIDLSSWPLACTQYLFWDCENKTCHCAHIFALTIACVYAHCRKLGIQCLTKDGVNQQYISNTLKHESTNINIMG